MSDKLQQMQDQRGFLSTSTETYGKIVHGIVEIMRNTPEWDSEKYHEICNLVYQYGCERMQYGFWDGAIESHLDMIDDKLDRLEAVCRSRRCCRPAGIAGTKAGSSA